jgi:hypothetical protein
MSKRVILFKKTSTAKCSGNDTTDGKRLQNYIESYLDETQKQSGVEAHRFQSERMMMRHGFNTTGEASGSGLTRTGGLRFAVRQ